MSLTFGDIDPTYYRYPSATHPLMLKPLVRHEERFFLVDQNLLYSSLRLGVEALLNPGHENAISRDEALWQAYERARAEYLEEKACQYFGDALKHGQLYCNLCYWADVNGRKERCELDGLIVMDSALFLIEAKAGTVSAPARRGAQKRMVTQLRELVQDAYEQALRARRYIETQGIASFDLPDGSSVKVDRSRIREIFLVNITLDCLEAFVTNAYELRDLGLFAEGDMPWSVSLTDLRVISELVEFPSQFVHYLLRRKRLNELGIAQTHDELDWFGHYLKEGLYFDDLANTTTAFS